MKKSISIRLIISVYKNTLFLKKVLDSVEAQVYRNFSVSIVEDGDSEVMKQFVQTLSYSFSITHESQEDIGFRKNRILNKAIRKASEDLLVFIDGDCVLHPLYLKVYAKYYDENSVMFAKRTNLDRNTSDFLLNTNIIVPTKLQMIRNGSTRVEDSFYLSWKPVRKTEKPYLLGSNMAIPLKILKSVNGFDEDYEITGYGEDCDIEWRIKKAGFSFLNLKFHSIQFHLYHERPDREDQTAISREIYFRKMKEGKFYCENGLTK